MIRRLIILLLIIGCDNDIIQIGFKKEEICVLKDDDSNKFDCYPQIDESLCKSDAQNKGFALIYHGDKYEDCQDWCNKNEVECNYY